MASRTVNPGIADKLRKAAADAVTHEGRDLREIFYDDDHREGQHTIVTETQGPLAGQRVVRGREAECVALHVRFPRPATIRSCRRRSPADLLTPAARV